MFKSQPNYMDAVNSLAEGKYLIGSDNGNGDVPVVWKEGATDLPTEEELQTELVRLNTVWTAQEYARNREAEYPTIAELTISLFDAGDKAALVTKRTAVKTKWPKDNSGPVE